MDVFTPGALTPAKPPRHYRLSPEQRQYRREIYARRRDQTREQQRRYRAEGRMP